MSFQQEEIVYRQQMETADQQGNISRDSMQACYYVMMIDPTTGEKIVTNKQGIITIPLDKYPGLKTKVEDFVPDFIAAFKQEYAEEIARLKSASQVSSGVLLALAPESKT